MPRRLRFVVPERINAGGQVVLPLDEGAVERLGQHLATIKIDSVAIGYLHSFTNPMHETRTRDLLKPLLPGVTITLSAEVSPEMREYERFSTACANAYVQVLPMLGRYLVNLETMLQEAGVHLPPVPDAVGRRPLRRSRRRSAFRCGWSRAGRPGGRSSPVTSPGNAGSTRSSATTWAGRRRRSASSTTISRRPAAPSRSRASTASRRAAGLPLRIPVIRDGRDQGANGGGSIARVDPLKRITVGPDSAGVRRREPACYGYQGGTGPTVTDADLLLGRIDPTGFSGGRMALDREAAEAAMQHEVAEKLALAASLAAFGVSEIVDDNMANAARVHAIESGKDAAAAVHLIAFGGAAPLHAARMAEKLGLDRVVDAVECRRRLRGWVSPRADRV